MKINVKNYKANELIRYIRDASGKTQREFAKDLDKSRTWCAEAEAGKTRIYLNDFLKLAKINDIEIILKEKK